MRRPDFEPCLEVMRVSTRLSGEVSTDVNISTIASIFVVFV